MERDKEMRPEGATPPLNKVAADFVNRRPLDPLGAPFLRLPCVAEDCMTCVWGVVCGIGTRWLNNA